TPAVVGSVGDLVSLVPCRPEQGPRRDPRDNLVRWHVPGHDGASPDEGPFADRHPAEDHRTGADGGPPSDPGRDDLPVGPRLQLPVGGHRLRDAVVDKAHVMAYKTFILDGDTLADERVRADLAARAHGGVLLDLDERADPGARADRTAVKVYELGVCDKYT